MQHGLTIVPPKTVRGLRMSHRRPLGLREILWQAAIDYLAAWIIARMPALVVSGRESQASTTSCNSGSRGAVYALTAALLSGFGYSSAFTGVVGGIINRWP